MSGSSIGTIFKLTSFGESHGPAIGGIIEGCPPNIDLNLEWIQLALDQRKPGQSEYTTARKESDQVTFLSGIYQGKSTGTPIGFTIPNEDQRPQDYDSLDKSYRPSHADFTYEKKYGHRDPRGGGRSSARETACRVVAGALAEQILNKIGVTFICYVDQIGHVRMGEHHAEYDQASINNSVLRCPDEAVTSKMKVLLDEVKLENDTIGGSIRCIISGVPVGLGEPVFDKLHADLAKAMVSINAVKGFEIGSGFSGIEMRGSSHNDSFNSDFTTTSNHSGGIQGGISNGMPIAFRVGFKPVATIMKPQSSVNDQGEDIMINPKGRHDPCVVPRAVPIVKAMASMVILDHYLRNKTLSL